MSVRGSVPKPSVKRQSLAPCRPLHAAATQEQTSQAFPEPLLLQLKEYNTSCQRNPAVTPNGA